VRKIVDSQSVSKETPTSNFYNKKRSSTATMEGGNLKFRLVAGYNCPTAILAISLTVVSGYYFSPKAKTEASVRTTLAEKGAV
jgi:hypothetical protein